MSASQVQLPATIRCQFYGVGSGAVDPPGIGEGASVEPCVFGGFLLADLFEAGVGDGLTHRSSGSGCAGCSRLFARRQKRHADQHRDQRE